jgi:ectoine hydroxylase-related dioxygenase (phytanoyl-CoA dioxygenase family)
VSNGYRLSSDPERLGWLEPTDPGWPVEQLWEQFQTQGYLWLKGILDRERVLDFRRKYFEALSETGLLLPGSDRADGIFSGGGQQKELVRKIRVQVVRWARYEAFCLAEAILSFYEAFLGGPVYLHKRKLLRQTIPGDPNSTGAHYDLTYLRGGTDRVCTSWIPIGDVPVEMGGLIYLEGSHTLGRKMESEFTALNAHLPEEEKISAYNRNMSETGWLTKDLPSLADRIAGRWLRANYEAGDMVVHSAYTIHAATTNLDSQQRIRLSTDIRYQLVADPIDARWGDHWSPNDKL